MHNEMDPFFLCDALRNELWPWHLARVACLRVSLWIELIPVGLRASAVTRVMLESFVFFVPSSTILTIPFLSSMIPKLYP